MFHHPANAEIVSPGTIRALIAQELRWLMSSS
jgi:hypothetical protein